MCSVWEGGLDVVEGGDQPSLTLPTSIRAVQPLASGLLILDQDGQMLVCRDGSVTALGCEQELGPIQELVGGQDEDGEEEIVCLLPSGRPCKVKLCAGQDQVEILAISQQQQPANQVTHIASSQKHLLYTDTRGQVWSRGLVPYCGLVQDSPEAFVRVPFFTGMEVLCIIAGPSFSLCMVRPSEAADVSPLSPSSEEAALVAEPSRHVPSSDLVDGDKESCPLGLSLKAASPPRPPTAVHQRLDHNLNVTQQSPSDGKQSGCDDDISAKERGRQLDVVDGEIQSTPRTVVKPGPVGGERKNVPTTLSLNGTVASFGQLFDSEAELPSVKMSFDDFSPVTSRLLTGPSSLSVDDFGWREVTRPSFARPLMAQRSASMGALSQKGFCLQELAPADLISEGLRLHSVEVWSWGSGSRGQLGQGDMLARPTPAPIPGLQGQYVIKLATGRHHALALTGSGQVYGWGDNSQGQACPTDSLAVVLHPSRMQLPQEETARDVTASGNASAILMDSGKVYVCGANGSSGGGGKSRLRVISADKLMNSGLPDQRPVSAFLMPAYFVINSAPVSSETASLVSREKMMLRQVDSVLQLLNTLLPSSSSVAAPATAASVEPTVRTVQLRLTEASSLLSAIIRRSSGAQDYSQTGLYRYSGAWIDLARSLCLAVCDCIASDSLLLDGQQAHQQHLITELLITRFGLAQSAVHGQAGLEQILIHTMKISEAYVKLLATFHHRTSRKGELTVEEESGKCAETSGLENRVARFMVLLQEMERERQVADRTRHFWKSIGSSSSRLIESQLAAVPSRRLVLDSRYQPVSLAGAITKHWLLLMSDVLVDYGYQLAVHPLETIWLESLPVAASSRYEIVLIMPEERKTLVAATSGERNIWLQALLKTICCSLQAGRLESSSQLPPVTRSARYKFTRGDFRDCSYSGSWTQAKMHGKGVMTWPDGSVYEGEWRGGLQDGWGRLRRADGGQMEGIWCAGRLAGRGGRISEPDGSQYDGDLLDGQPHGHGTKKEGKFMNRGASVYVGEWERGQRHGYGVLDDITAGEKYMGMWVAGQRQGPACVVNSDGIYYEGNFVHNRLTGGGLMIFEDGAVYEGEFSGACEFAGKGVLTTATERFEGVFHGNYTDRMRFNGVVLKHATPLTPVESETPPAAATAKVRQHTVPAYKKWISIFQQLDELMGRENCWDQIAIALNLNKARARERGSSSSRTAGSLLDSLEMIPEVGRPGLQLDWARYGEVVQYLTAAGQCELHPFYYTLRQLTECFITSYGGVRSHATLLPHAREELESICSRLYQLLRRLFPLLPSHETPSWLTGPGTTGEPPLLVTPNTVLLPLLLPPLHPTIFTLYALREQKSDKEYWARILRWNRHPDLTLLTFFDVDFSLWDLAVVERRGRDQLFLTAIHTLQKLKTTFSPQDKLEVIVQTFRAITGQAETANQTWSMDALLPVSMYVVVRARVLQLGAELAMLQDFMDNHLFQGEQGILYTTLLAAYHQILRESVFIN